MKRILIRAVSALVAFAVGIGSTLIWSSRWSSTSLTLKPASDCGPHFNPNVLAESLREDDDPQFFGALEEVPLHALPGCVDEAYSLSWIPSFHEPVLVRVWRSKDRAFMVAKILDTKGWSKFGKVKQTNLRPLTEYEWREFTELLNRSSYWERPSTMGEIIPEDGVVWLIDGFRNKQYHWVRRRVPDEQYAASVST